MAGKELVLKFKWENKESFQLTSKLDQGETITILSLEENSCLAEIWDIGVKPTIMAYIELEVGKIGADMKAP